MADNFSSLIDDLRQAREEIKAVNAEFEDKLRPIKDREADIEQKLISKLKAAGLEGAKNGKLAAARSVMTLPKIDDFEKFTVYVLRNRALHLFERRIGRNAYRELLESRKGKEIPGLSHIEKESITLRASE